MEPLLANSPAAQKPDRSFTPVLSIPLDDQPTPLQIKALLQELDLVARRLRQLVGELLPVGESRLLHLLTEVGPCTVPHLARLRGTSRQNIQVLVNRLEREGLVVLNPNPAHKRSDLVALTPAGHDRLMAAAEDESKLAQRLSAHLTQTELEKAVQLLRKIQQSIAPEPPEPGHRRRRRGSERTPPSKRAPEQASPGRKEAPSPTESTDYELPVSLL